MTHHTSNQNSSTMILRTSIEQQLEKQLTINSRCILDCSQYNIPVIVTKIEAQRIFIPQQKHKILRKQFLILCFAVPTTLVHAHHL